MEWSGERNEDDKKKRLSSNGKKKTKKKKKQEKAKKNQVSLPMFSYCSLQSSYVHPENKVSRRCQT